MKAAAKKRTVQSITTTANCPWQPQSLRAAKGAEGKRDLYLASATTEVWHGFGGCFNELGWIALQALPAAAQAKVIAALFSERGLGLNIGRIPVGASDYAAEWYSHNEQPEDFAMRHFSIERDRQYLLPYIQAALDVAPELSFFASPWSPPTWLKYPRAHNFGRMIMEPRYLEAYALYFSRFLSAYAKAGVKIGQLHPQNEPVADQKFPSCLWSGEQLRQFIGGYLGPKLAREHPQTELWLGTMNSDDFDGMFLPVLLDPKCREYVRGVGVQWAGKGAVQRVRRAFPELGLMQTENECGDGTNTWAYARYVFNLAVHYISNGCTSYVYWNMVLPPGGESTWGWKQNAMITVDPRTRRVTYNPEYWVMRHLAHVIRPGMRRVVLGGPWASNALGFVADDGSTRFVVANPLAVEQSVDCTAAGQSVRVALPPESFTSIVLPATD